MTQHPPRMDHLLACPPALALAGRFGSGAVKGALREALASAREGWRAGGPVPEPEALVAEAARILEESFAPVLQRVINATGVVLHTNLGRAPLPADALREAAGVLSGYVDLELDLAGGGRGHRDARLEGALQDLLQTDRALVVVNNNAAATLLMLNTLSKGRETLVSRGELVEIGGGFRVPEVMAASGALLREVGTTNRTRLSDFRAAVGTASALLLKVHPSNYRIVGFTEEVELAELAAMGGELGLSTAMDLGSGLVAPGATLGLAGEPSVEACLKAGADALCFSADKLFGACQAGLLLVKPDLAPAFRANPLLRALRADKLAYFLLGAVLSSYRRGAPEEIPALALLATPAATLLRRARRLRRRIEALVPGRFAMAVEEGEGRAGGGTAPLAALSSPVLALVPHRASAADLETHLRAGGAPPVLAQVADGRVLVHLRTLLQGDLEVVARRVAAFQETHP